MLERYRIPMALGVVVALASCTTDPKPAQPGVYDPGTGRACNPTLNPKCPRAPIGSGVEQ